MGGLDTIIFDPRPPPSLLNFFFRSARVINPIKIIIHVFEYSLQKITLIAIIRP